VNFRYSRNYFPPVPTVDITFITAAEFSRIGPLQAIVDSGADGTIVPINYLEEIQAPPTVEMVIRSQWGERRNILLYLVDVQIGDLTLPGVEVVGDELSDEIVLGRNILNLLRVLLDGPREVVEVSE
jgi:hypothetical protein